MSLTAVSDTSGVIPFDEQSRRQWIKAHLLRQGMYHEDSLDTRYRSSVDGIAKKLHALELDQVGEIYFEFLCDEAVWMKTCKYSHPFLIFH